MQGFNMGRYVPPEHEGQVSGNKLAGKHALGNRARKAGQGILTVRFEMPYAIWCTTCPKETIIGQGVRFNATKKKVGSYYSSPIYSFRMKHTACGGWIEIRTDPKNTAYVVVEGARKRETGEDEARDGDIVLRTEEEKERLRNDAFAALEVTIEGRQQEKMDRDRVNELLDATDRDWDDPYAINKRLRNNFRVGRKHREKEHTIAEEIKDRFGLSLELLPESEQDARRAAAVDFGQLDVSPDAAIRRAESRELFPQNNTSTTTLIPLKLKAEKAVQASKRRLREELGHNTRAVTDPFLVPKSFTTTPLLGIKRKRLNKILSDNVADAGPVAVQPQSSKNILVDYDSD